ncbi:GNAT family N-acetyltransferase [Vibrio sp. SCSIO 43135]|uniref:GNAT family N-acetyltransferase n=1 Tax=Vibrio sp. SCSIO 43135 TaxID=2819096 RepID=UPI0020752F90|nr:GNAT family N-acetyltransferase [Vibrio sp. SCSIO 43135]USD41293.1 GNAT family N-acetyltransferase [Vibrio sp. SCSIO 43135]
MSTLKVEVLDPIKLPLVSRLYKAHYSSGKAKKDELTIVGYVESEIVAVVRFRVIEHYRLLTGMLVSPKYRGQGFGHDLMRYCVQAGESLTSNDYCFAYPHLEGFYSQHGFVTIDESKLPASLRGLYGRYSRNKQLVPMQYFKTPLT